MLNWHEVINDKLGAEAIVVTWCPLCGSALVFNREVDGEVLDSNNQRGSKGFKNEYQQFS